MVAGDGFGVVEGGFASLQLLLAAAVQEAQGLPIVLRLGTTDLVEAQVSFAKLAHLAGVDGDVVAVEWSCHALVKHRAVIAQSCSLSNADGHPVMRRYKPDDEKRMVVILDRADYGEWLTCPVDQAPKFFKQWMGELDPGAAGVQCADLEAASAAEVFLADKKTCRTGLCGGRESQLVPDLHDGGGSQCSRHGVEDADFTERSLRMPSVVNNDEGGRVSCELTVLHVARLAHGRAGRVRKRTDHVNEVVAMSQVEDVKGAGSSFDLRVRLELGIGIAGNDLRRRLR